MVERTRLRPALDEAPQFDGCECTPPCTEGAVPFVDDEIEVSFVNDEDDLVWWPAIVESLDPNGCTDKEAAGGLIFRPMYEHGEERCNVKFLPENHLRAVGDDGQYLGVSKWRKCTAPTRKRTGKRRKTGKDGTRTAPGRRSMSSRALITSTGRSGTVRLCTLRAVLAHLRVLDVLSVCRKELFLRLRPT